MTPDLPGYREALAWLYARSRHGAPRDPSRAAALLRALGVRPPPLVVRVVGTNGKGTVTSMVAEGLRAAGVRTGRFLSPHVEDFRERIEIDGRPLARRTVRAFVARVRAMEGAPDAAFFELTLALALHAFRRAGAGAAVLEAGVGGASDATQAVAHVRLVVLTNVTLDHVDTLGPDLATIARDKAGAAEAGVPLVTGASGEALEWVRRRAVEVGAPLWVDRPSDPHFALPVGTVTPEPPVRGRNARLACAALRLLGVDEAAVAAAVRAPALPARAESFVLGSRTVVLDGAHDPAAAAALADTLPRGYVLLFGALPRKQGPATLAPLEARASRVIVTSAAAGEAPLEMGPGRLRIEDPRRALDAALAAAPEGGTVAIAGSLYLAGRLRGLLRRRAARATPGPARIVPADGRPARDGAGAGGPVYSRTT